MTILALFTRLVSLGFPNVVVFDEVYFRNFAASYLNGSFFFDIHPPLVKLIFAGVAQFFGLSAVDVLNGESATVALRLLPALAGAALVPMIYVLARQYKFSRKLAALAAIFVLFDNALTVESRFVLMDSMLLLVGMMTLSAFVKLKSIDGNQRIKWIILAGILTGTLASIKWTGLAIVGLIGIYWIVQTIRTKKYRRRSLREMVIVGVLALAVYAGTFAVSLGLLQHTGDGDDFMSLKFQSTLIGNPHYNAEARMSFWEKFVEINAQMFSSQQSLEHATHPYASRWYSWPFEVKPVYYWQGAIGADGKQGNIYLLGNPAVWWTAAVAVIVAAFIWLLRPKIFGKRRGLIVFLLAGYLLNYIPFAFIERPMFLYHYLFALLFAILILITEIELLLKWIDDKYGEKVANRIYKTIIAVVVIGFLYFVPFTYGNAMLPADISGHQWLNSWR